MRSVLIVKYNYTFLYIVLTAISVTCINKLGSKIPDDLMIMLSSLYAIIFFHAVKFQEVVHTYRKLINIKLTYLKMMLAFLLVWGLSFLIPIYFSPTLLIFFVMAWPTCIASYYKYKKTNRMSDKLTMIAFCAVIIAFYICLFPKYNFASYCILIIGLTVVGVSAYVYYKLSYEMNLAQFSATEILAIRFWLLFLIPLVITIYNHHIWLIDFEVLSSTLVLSFITLIIPVYCSQKSVVKIGVSQHSILIGFTPFVGYLVEKLFVRDTQSLSALNQTFTILLAIMIVIVQLNQVASNKNN